MLWACGLYSGCFQVNVRATKCPRWLPEATWSVCWFPNGHVTYQKLHSSQFASGAAPLSCRNTIPATYVISNFLLAALRKRKDILITRKKKTFVTV